MKKKEIINSLKHACVPNEFECSVIGALRSGISECDVLILYAFYFGKQQGIRQERSKTKA